MNLTETWKLSKYYYLKLDAIWAINTSVRYLEIKIKTNYFLNMYSYLQTINTCTDPESFAREGPTLTSFFLNSFFLMRGERIQMSLKEGHHRPTSKTPFEWRFAGGRMMAQH